MTYEAARDVIAHHSALSSTNRLALLDFLHEHPGQARELFRVDAAHGFLPAHKDQYFGQNLSSLVVNDAIVAKRFVIRAGFFQTLPIG
jgi:hypothetical protein